MVLSVTLGYYDQAEIEEDILLAEFAGRSELPNIVYDIGGKYLAAMDYQDARRYGSARRLFRYILQNHPDSTVAESALRTVPELDIWLGEYDEAKADTAALMAQLAERPELPVLIYEIAYKYRLAEQYADSLVLYKYIRENHPASDAADTALGMMALLDIRMGNYDAAQSDIELLIAKFTGSPVLVSFLSEIAYEYHLAGRTEDYQRVYDYGAQNTFNSGDALDGWTWQTLLDIRTGIYEPAQCDVKMRESVAWYLSETFLDPVTGGGRVYTIGSMFYYLAEDLAEKGEVEASRNAYLRAVAVWDEIDGLDASEQHRMATYSSGVSYDKIDQLDKAFEYYQEFVEQWPGHRYVPIAHFQMAVRAQRAQELGFINAQRADEILEDSLERVVVDHPYCTLAKTALRILGDHYFAKGAYDEAIDYYEELLGKDIMHLGYVVDNYAAALEALGEAETAAEVRRVYSEMSP